MKDLLLVDYSAIWRKHWHTSVDAEVSFATRSAVAEIRALASDYLHVAICLDHPSPTWRHERAPSYKAGREKLDNLAVEQLRAGVEQLRADGFAILEAAGLEADDVIATVVHRCRAEHTITIASHDKDLMQLLGDRVEMWNTGKRETWTAATCLTRLGVTVGQLGDYLALVGDKSDNVPGVPGIGAKRAAELLQRYSEIGYIIAEREKLPPAQAKAIGEAVASGQLKLSRELIELRLDAPIDTASIFAARKPCAAQPEREDYDMTYDDADNDRELPEDNEPDDRDPALKARGGKPPADKPATAVPAIAIASSAPSLAQPAIVPAPVASPVEIVDEAPRARALATSWERGLEPATRGEAWRVAQMVIASRMFSGFGGPEQAMLIIMAGRELGLGTFASLKGFHVIKNRPVMAAQLMMALCLRDPSCTLFRVLRSECTNEKAVVLVERRGWKEPERYEWTMADASGAGLEGKDNWRGYARAMLINRCIAEAARFTWPELVGNVYCPEDFGDRAAA